ncbi:MAG: endonuclease III [Saprospiraceae bacterium]|nr:endonuclease III [Saprospiraceae bacterium]
MSLSKKQKAIEIQKILEALFPDVPVPLQHKDPFTLLVAVLLSAQCTDERVNKITPQLFALADNPSDMSKLSLETIKEMIRPCGLSENKSKAIKSLSEILHNKYHDQVPDQLELLEELPGVGHKTASVVMAQAFGVPSFPVDTHIHRLAWRWGLSSGKNVTQTETDLKKLFPKDNWNKLHLQIIYFGRKFCPARGHQKALCPICSMYGKKELE